MRTQLSCLPTHCQHIPPLSQPDLHHSDWPPLSTVRSARVSSSCPHQSYVRTETPHCPPPPPPLLSLGGCITPPPQALSPPPLWKTCSPAPLQWVHLCQQSSLPRLAAVGPTSHQQQSGTVGHCCAAPCCCSAAAAMQAAHQTPTLQGHTHQDAHVV